MKNKCLFVLSVSIILSSCASKQRKPSSQATTPENVPSLTAPEVRRFWVPEKIEGSRFIDGHYEHLIEKPSFWTR